MKVEWSCLFNAKPDARCCHGHPELFVELLLGRVHGQVNAVETGVGPGVGARVVVDSLNGEPSDGAIHALQIGKSTQWHPGRAGGKLQQTSAHFGIEFFRNDLPEPLDYLVGPAFCFHKTNVASVTLPADHVNMGKTTQHELQLVGIKQRSRLARESHPRNRGEALTAVVECGGTDDA